VSKAYEFKFFLGPMRKFVATSTIIERMINQINFAEYLRPKMLHASDPSAISAMTIH
jgi:hypothetical protein